MRWLPSIQWHLQGGAAQSVEGRLCRTLLSAITPGLGIHDGQRRIFARPTRGPWWAALLDGAVALNAAIPGGGNSMLVAQLAPQDLAHRRLGQFGAELDHLGLLVARQFMAAELAHLGLGQVRRL